MILVTFDDGTTELRPANSPALVQPANMHDVASLGYRRIGPIALASTRDVCSQMPLHVWRITGGLGKGEPLTGEWCHCKVETVEEQIARLTRERDAEKVRVARWKALAKRYRHAIMAARWWHEHKVEEWSSSCDILEEDLTAEKARADAAEKRLAEESAAAYRRGRADATKSAIAVLDETHASIESGGPSALVDMLGVVVDTIAEAIETREEDWK